MNYRFLQVSAVILYSSLVMFLCIWNVIIHFPWWFLSFTGNPNRVELPQVRSGDIKYSTWRDMAIIQYIFYSAIITTGNWIFRVAIFYAYKLVCYKDNRLWYDWKCSCYFTNTMYFYRKPLSILYFKWTFNYACSNNENESSRENTAKI